MIFYLFSDLTSMVRQAHHEQVIISVLHAHHERELITSPLSPPSQGNVIELSKCSLVGAEFG